jgi:hypothetical protein
MALRLLPSVGDCHESRKEYKRFRLKQHIARKFEYRIETIGHTVDLQLVSGENTAYVTLPVVRSRGVYFVEARLTILPEPGFDRQQFYFDCLPEGVGQWPWWAYAGYTVYNKHHDCLQHQPSGRFFAKRVRPLLDTVRHWAELVPGEIKAWRMTWAYRYN